MIDHDKCIGEMLDLLDKLGIADNTFVHVQHRQRAALNTWPDAGTTPFRNEKNTSWEGAYRVPAWCAGPGKIEAGLGLQRDRQPPGLVADPPRRRPASRTSRRSSRRATRPARRPSRSISTATTCFRSSRARNEKSPRDRTSSTSPTTATWSALRYDNWKMLFMEQRVQGTLRSGTSLSVLLRRRTSSTCGRTRTSRRRLRPTPSTTGCSGHFPAGAGAGHRRANSWRPSRIPPRQKAASFSLDQVIAKMTEALQAPRLEACNSELRRPGLLAAPLGLATPSVGRLGRREQQLCHKFPTRTQISFYKNSDCERRGDSTFGQPSPRSTSITSKPAQSKFPFLRKIIPLGR